MWEKVSIEFEEEAQVKNGNWFSTLQQSFRFLFIFSKYVFLGGFMILLASHEVVKTGIGEEGLEYYGEEFRRGMIARLADVKTNDTVKRDVALVKEFYQIRNYQPVWTTNFKPNGDFFALMELIRESYHYGLLPSTYAYHDLTATMDRLQKDMDLKARHLVRIALEEQITQSALLLMKHIGAGIRDKDTSDAYRYFVASLPNYLNQQLKQKRLRMGILALQPQNLQYKQLQEALSSYLYKSIGDTVGCSIEELEGNLLAVSGRLIRQGYLDKSFEKDTLAIISALNQFQRVHYLKVSNEPDKKTLQMLCQGTRETFYRIALNLDRIRKDELKNTNSILVNIPEFKLHYFDAQGKEMDFRVVVGKTSSPTPQITSELKTIVTNPYWTVPRSITRNEILPKIKKDSMYLQRNGYTVVNNANEPVDASSIDWQNVEGKEFKYWIRQTKINNALGVVKFLFPNEYSVYLHDTPSKSLFNKTVRAYSHGCIRVENPQELAQALVSNYTRSEEDVMKTIKDKERKEIEIDESVSIYIRYYSCTADSLGTIYFHPDIYAQDQKAIDELFAQSSWN